ncbi:hypothetical protein T492DRAFT_968473 [Pavlovales sp. CCMP2436]|nr:hypothetical protein T492DRAFT_968473 [Pavlovales sp. CCMP2436]
MKASANSPSHSASIAHCFSVKPAASRARPVLVAWSTVAMPTTVGSVRVAPSLTSFRKRAGLEARSGPVCSACCARRKRRVHTHGIGPSSASAAVSAITAAMGGSSESHCPFTAARLLADPVAERARERRSMSLVSCRSRGDGGSSASRARSGQAARAPV